MNNMPTDTALMKVYEGVKHTEISEEFILPDYLPDIKRIIRAEARPRIDGKFITTGRVEYEGDIVCHLLFCDESNKLRSVTFTAAFSDGFDLPEADDECIANLIPSPESINCRMLNPRRISLRLRLDTECTVWCRRSFRPEITGELSPSGIETLDKEIEVLDLICAGESGLSASADLEADGALPQIGEVVNCNVEMSFYECKGSDGKVLCRGDMPITVFYSTPGQTNDDGTESPETYTVLYRKLPIAQVVSVDGVDEGYECMARGSVDDVKFTVAENGFGERRILELDITYRIYLNCVCRATVKLTQDMYACDRAVQSECLDSAFYRHCRSYNTSFGANSVISREELGITEASGIYEVCTTPKITSLTLSDDGHRLTVSGTAFCAAVLAGNDGLFSTEYEIPLKLDLDASGIPENFIYNCDTVCMSARGRLDSEKLYTDLEIQINLMILGETKEKVLQNAAFSEKAERSDGASMRFFYPSDGETLWDIAKHFSVPMNSLADVNSISDKKLPEVMLIPNK